MQKIDMSSFIESGLDCEFSSNSFFQAQNTSIGKLTEINKFNNEDVFVRDDKIGYSHCRPRFGEWLYWGQYKKPICDGFIISLKTLSGDHYRAKSKELNSTRYFSRFRVLSIRIDDLDENFTIFE
jgi:hypothetical protein